MCIRIVYPDQKISKVGGVAHETGTRFLFGTGMFVQLEGQQRKNFSSFLGWVVSLWKQSQKNFVIATYNRELVIIWIRIVYLDQILLKNLKVVRGTCKPWLWFYLDPGCLSKSKILKL